jgi:hypothetical protein
MGHPRRVRCLTSALHEPTVVSERVSLPLFQVL